VRHHSDSALQVLAARILGDDQHLLSIVAAPRADLEPRLAAMEALQDRPAAIQGIEAAVASDQPRLWRSAALLAAGCDDVRATQLLATLTDRMDTTTWPDERPASAYHIGASRRLAEALAQLPPHPDGEGLLVQLLTHDDAPTRAAAAEALGRVGTVKAVPALREAGERWFSPDAVREAVRTIQARASGERGGLAIAHAHGGELALAARHQGGLALAEPSPERQAEHLREAANLPEHPVVGEHDRGAPPTRTPGPTRAVHEGLGHRR